MTDKIETIYQKYCELESSLASNEIIDNITLYTQKMKEMKSIEAIAILYREIQALKKERDDTITLFHSSVEDDIKKLATEEINSLESVLEQKNNELKILLLPKDPLDEKSVIVEIRACAGGEEAALFVADLYRMYFMYAQNENYKITVLNSNQTELGGYKEIDFMIEGHAVYSKLKFESGVHRVQRVPTTESQGRIQTSTVSVAILPEVTPIEININPQDITFETCKSSGAGGQHINKTESAVRLIHKPSGIVVECQEERSQYKNRDKAMIMLCSKLKQMKQEEQNNRITTERRTQIGSGDRSEKIRTYNFPQNRVTDHRIGLTLHSLDDVMNGKLEPIINALRIHQNTNDLLNTED